LDLFAGSGALAFEALSRGAEYVTVIELDVKAHAYLRDNASVLSAIECTDIRQSSAQDYLVSCEHMFDVVFIDPPYQANVWSDIAELIHTRSLLVKGGYVYLECPSKAALPVLPSEWQLLKDKIAGDVRYCLFQNEA
jgi:16S rRNA (guanine966-N2)-methyltransferase